MKIVKIILFAAGIVLLALDVSGLFRSMRNPELYAEDNTGRINDITLKLDDARKQIHRLPGETDKDFAIRLNDVVSRSMMHYFKKEGEKKYHLSIPAWENYLLYAEQLFMKDRRYEFSNAYKNLERGVGLCSTHSIVVKGVLLDNGIEAHLWDIAGHVVVRAKVADNEWYILDPDYGLYVPYDIDAIEADPELVRPTYANMANLYKLDYDDPYTTGHVVEIYGKEGNHIYTVDSPFEKFSYVAIWIIPFLLMIPLAFRRKNKV